MTVWFTADQHFGHENIIIYCQRPFTCTKEMDKIIISNYCRLVEPSDTVYFLGDFTLWGSSRIPILEQLLDQLPGNKILILGNHDKLKPLDYVELGFTSVHTLLDIGQFVLFHDPALSLLYPKRHCLCGHVHTLFTVTPNRRVLNVGVDAHRFSPIDITSVEKLFIKSAIEYKEGISIYFDLDGVLRNLASSALGCEPHEWDCKKDGVSMLDIVSADERLLITADPLPYIDVYKWCLEVGLQPKILSAQVPKWIPKTLEWIYLHIGKHAEVTFVSFPEDKLKYLTNQSSILIDDYPFFSSHKDNIIIVDHLYNKLATGFKRVSSAKELKYKLWEIITEIKDTKEG